MIDVKGYIRLESGVWLNMRTAKMMRVWLDPQAHNFRIEVKACDGEDWLCDKIYDTEDDACDDLDRFFGMKIGEIDANKEVESVA